MKVYANPNTKAVITEAKFERAVAERIEFEKTVEHFHAWIDANYSASELYDVIGSEGIAVIEAEFDAHCEEMGRKDAMSDWIAIEVEDVDE